MFDIDGLFILLKGKVPFYIMWDINFYDESEVKHTVVLITKIHFPTGE